jgi:hypothetical protein
MNILEVNIFFPLIIRNRLTISSIKSFRAFRISTQLRGKIVVIGFSEDICGIS